MAWYRIAENVLDAIADAINAKTGGTSPMTPVEMVTEIGTISGGSGTPRYTLIYDDTLTEDANTIRIDFSATMQAYKWIYFLADSPTGSPTYPYITANKTTGGTYLGAGVLAKAFILPNAEDMNTGVVDFRDNFTYPISYIYIRGYYVEQKFLTGTRIRMWGVS